MALTKAQRRLSAEIAEILGMAGMDWRTVEDDYEPAARLHQLLRIKQDFIRAKIISDYVFVDELLTVTIVSYFFPTKQFPSRFRKKKFRTFMHFVMEELYLLRKLALVKEIRGFDPSMARVAASINVLRNAMAHSFDPAKKRDFREVGKVTYKGKDIYAVEGLRAYDADATKLHDYLFAMAFGKRLASFLPAMRGVEAANAEIAQDDNRLFSATEAWSTPASR